MGRLDGKFVLIIGGELTARPAKARPSQSATDAPPRFSARAKAPP